MSKPAKSTGQRFWFDPRFAIGLVLVVAAVVGVYWIVAGSDQTTAVFAARSTLAVGDHVEASDLVATRVRLGSADALYVTPDRLPQEGLLVTRTIAAGELVPASAVGRTSGAESTSIVVELTSSLAASIGPGSVVDVWSSRSTGQAAYGPPTVLVGRAAVVRLIEPSGLAATSGIRSLEVLVPKDTVAAVLESIANRDAIAVVPVNAPLGE
ncbi:hypothetical protein E3T26_06820 [Cryobacterium sp. TMT1-21]|uniref:SAF domain-containing protein n=1 Tax=Cryobacterium shii TaxID=1259235 RepID=A0AAQ2C7C1_9MICO|nr:MULTISPECIES: hypothetical protein [Cryobacterium]TFC49799.1 hypothetical protein E3O49_05865 [Cryobacterium shii]TFC84028.1 hypothetical protein E3T24_10995 [Cryobacterium sp. TmT2-59]TFD15488.1 hypothetical protein E3T26_06820 [Cryobacterium sp. TMT1-21]TFD16130.1 hypothetical protein E3T42_09725 [Cryobacterium sp. TMT4-10]TFD39782.1 hypothetical protein E3T37_07445 [Cryobacterium sp. TMT2-10]